MLNQCHKGAKDNQTLYTLVSCYSVKTAQFTKMQILYVVQGEENVENTFVVAELNEKCDTINQAECHIEILRSLYVL